MGRVGEAEREDQGRDQRRHDIEVVTDPTHHADGPEQSQADGGQGHQAQSDAAEEAAGQEAHQHEDERHHRREFAREQAPHLRLHVRRARQHDLHVGRCRARAFEQRQVEVPRQELVLGDALEGDEDRRGAAVPGDERARAQWIGEQRVAQHLGLGPRLDRLFEVPGDLDVSVHRADPQGRRQALDVVNAFRAA